MRKTVNERWANQRFGRLYIVSAWAADQVTHAICKCDCGTVWTCRVGDIKSGNTSSCGCYASECKSIRAKTHGKTDTRAYSIWSDMKKRCLNKKHKSFQNYGGRGITLCQEWAASFDSFISDMGWPPSPSHEIDRMDVNGNYNPSNCRWATRTQNMRNTRRAVVVQYQGQSIHLKELSELTGIKYHTLYYRLRHGVDLLTN